MNQQKKTSTRDQNKNVSLQFLFLLRRCRFILISSFHSQLKNERKKCEKKIKFVRFLSSLFVHSLMIRILFISWKTWNCIAGEVHCCHLWWARFFFHQEDQHDWSWKIIVWNWFDLKSIISISFEIFHYSYLFWLIFLFNSFSFWIIKICGKYSR